MKNITRDFEDKYRSSKNKEAFVEAERLMTLRKLDRTSRVKPSINFYSHKLKALAYAESILEMDAYLRLEFETTVKRYLTQPYSFKLEINNKMTRYTPDALVEDIHGNHFFLEVKPETKVNEEKNKTKFLQIKSFFEDELNVPFKIITEKDIRSDKLIPNLQQLYGFLNVALNKKVTTKIMNALPEEITVKTLENISCLQGQLAHYAWALIAHGYFNFNFEKMLTKSTLISINESQLGA